MNLLNNLPDSFATLTEMRLNAAMKIAALKEEVDKYQELAKSPSESNICRTEMRLTAAIKIAALKMEIEKYRELGGLAMPSSDIVSGEEISPHPTPAPTINQNGSCSSESAKEVKEPCKTKISESDWVNQQAKKLLGARGLKKRFATK